MVGAVGTTLISIDIVLMIVVMSAVMGMMMSIIMDMIFDLLLSPERHGFDRVGGNAVFAAV